MTLFIIITMDICALVVIAQRIDLISCFVKNSPENISDPAEITNLPICLQFLSL